LAGDELERLHAVSDVPLLYPYWHQAAVQPGRFRPADLSLIQRRL
jgi:hypothetical protein